MLFFICSLFSWYLLGASPEQPARENNHDFRKLKILFSIHQEKLKSTYSLESTGNLEYFLRSSRNEKNQLIKISSSSAQKLEKDFFGKFFKCQYQLPSDKSNCEITLRLNLRGEKQNICQKEDKKTQEVQSFMNELEKLF